MNEPRLIVRVSLGGGPEHRLGTLIGMAVALEKGYAVEDNTAWRGGKAIPDGVIYEQTLGKSRSAQVGGRRYWLETIWRHDPRLDWHLAGYNVTDVITADISECVDETGRLDLNAVYAAWRRAIP